MQSKPLPNVKYLEQSTRAKTQEKVFQRAKLKQQQKSKKTGEKQTGKHREYQER